MPQEHDTDAFISELTHAAGETGNLTKLQCARLLQRAAATLHRVYHCKIDYSGTPANSRWQGPAVYRWPEMPLRIDTLSDEEISSELRHAALLMKTSRG
ncbi:hypothetical protein PV773_06170 [Mesorhizobium sp. CC13]|jgi:hypothetical protein|uniref:hypothetical protein n=1 Tax=unclassified Mesorhizobium TaxID=325217 RepID=UPI0028F74A6F|nr:hypothetical protein [Mesorhizobium sp. SP-1A]